MKKRFLCYLFKPAVYNRALRLKTKQLKRYHRLLLAIEEMNKWDDIPLSWQLDSLCRIVKIQPNVSAFNFFMELNMGASLEEKAKKLPL